MVVSNAGRPVQMAQKKQKKTKTTYTHLRVRDVLVVDATSNAPTAINLATDSSGSVAIQNALAPLGINGLAILSAASGSPVSFSQSTVATPALPWLYNTARSYERYRVVSATLVFISNVSATTAGRVMLDSSTDYSDTLTPPYFGTSAGGKVYSLASAANKELRLNMDVDSSWKKVSKITNTAYASGVTAPISTMNELLFTNYIVAVQGAPVNTNVGTLSIEYDVEFRDPIAFAANI